MAVVAMATSIPAIKIASFRILPPDCCSPLVHNQITVIALEN
jgi:hypothetical protein